MKPPEITLAPQPRPSRDHEHVAGPLGYYLLADLLNRTGRPREAVRLSRELEQSEAGRRRIPA